VRVVNRLVVGEWEEYLLDCQESDFALPIGPTHPASLYTDKVIEDPQRFPAMIHKLLLFIMFLSIFFIISAIVDR